MSTREQRAYEAQRALAAPQTPPTPLMARAPAVPHNHTPAVTAKGAS